MVMQGDRPLGGGTSRTRRAFSAVAVSAVVAVAVSAPMALRVLDAQQTDDENPSTTTVPVDVSVVGQTTLQPGPSGPANSIERPEQTVPPSVLGTTVERDDTEATSDG